jgi:hypothetical protein
MFAHQVIDSLLAGIKNWSGVFPLDGVVRDIKMSQKFHIEEPMQFYDMFKPGNPLFKNEMADVELPYSSFWVDWCFPNDGSKWSISKRALLCHGFDKKIEVLIFGFVHSKNEWVLGPFCYGIDLTKGEVGVGFTGKRESYSEFGHKELIEGSAKDDGPDLTLLNYLLLLLSCKNISKESHKPSEALNKKRIKHLKQPLFTYHTLVLRPVGKKQESIPRHLWENRIHLCRGHFKTYTQDKPLFGRITGRFWWQPSVRGRNHEGIVMKDYIVKAA